jgi:hypothetical protein
MTVKQILSATVVAHDLGMSIKSDLFSILSRISRHKTIDRILLYGVIIFTVLQGLQWEQRRECRE